MLLGVYWKQRMLPNWQNHKMWTGHGMDIMRGRNPQGE